LPVEQGGEHAQRRDARRGHCRIADGGGGRHLYLHRRGGPYRVSRRALSTRGATEGARPRGKAKEKPAATGAPLDRKQVERLVGRLDKAMSKRSPKAVTALLAKDAVVEVHSGAGSAADPMDTKAFARYLTAAFARPGYVYRAQPPRISLSKSKPRATVTRAVRETVLVAGSVVVTDLHERLTVERDGRRLLIRKLRKAAPAAEGPA
jgi:hypothetical protein